MDLIIKPTQKCNFCCDFCSSNNIDSSGNNILPLESVYSLLKQNNIDSLIINGGDPLMMPPKYYFDIINFIKDNNLNTKLSFTTNLWDFYINPDKWTPLFKNDRVRVATSFQYGNGRKIKPFGNKKTVTIFSEEIFTKVMNLFKEKIGYVPIFISVITNDNEDKVIDTVLLAKKLKTKCKINPVVKSGRSSEYYPTWKAYQKYLEIIELGLTEYEFNATILKEVLENKNHTCPYCRNCWQSIRAIGPNKILHSCGAYEDDYLANIKQNKKTYDLINYRPKQILIDHRSLKKDCFACQLFPLCNSCFKRMNDMMEDNAIEDHCSHMKSMIQRFNKL